ncbi:hypothetical protein [Microbispora sp. NPDC049633]|uniref:hypothetical protein n=1 Tax=Microbispora sp. NPDC049633 TaxID=3154355 RepID=UPI003423A643
MTGWLIVGGYVAGLVYTARRFALSTLEHDEKVFGENDAEDRMMARMMGFLVGLFWPGALIMLLVTGKLPKTSGELKRELAEAEVRVKERELRIKELEHELGIGS